MAIAMVARRYTSCIRGMLRQNAGFVDSGRRRWLCALDDVWLKEEYIYGRPRHAHISDMCKLSAVEQTNRGDLPSSESKGLTPEKALAQLIKDKGMGQRADWHGSFRDSDLTNYEKIRAHLPQATLLPASMFFRYVRMIKTPAEIQRLRESAQINENAINAMLRACKPGVRENELASIYKGEIAKAGGQVYWMHMAVTRGGNYPAIKDNVLQKGDIFRVDMGCSMNGYHADVCKSGCVGAEPTAEHRKRYDADPGRRTEIGRSAEARRASARALRNHGQLECAPTACQIIQTFFSAIRLA